MFCKRVFLKLSNHICNFVLKLETQDWMAVVSAFENSVELLDVVVVGCNLWRESIGEEKGIDWNSEFCTWNNNKENENSHLLSVLYIHTIKGLDFVSLLPSECCLVNLFIFVIRDSVFSELPQSMAWMYQSVPNCSKELPAVVLRLQKWVCEYRNLRDSLFSVLED